MKIVATYSVQFRTRLARVAVRGIDAVRWLGLIGEDVAWRLAVRAARRLTLYRMLDQRGRPVGEWRRVEDPR